MMFDNSLKYKWDNKNVIDYAREEGKEEGIKQGLEKGRYKKALEIARELKKEGLSINLIVKTTKLSIEEIENL